MLIARYTQGADLPDLAITWEDRTGAVIQFAAGHTFALKVGHLGQAATLTKTTGITGANTAPNVTVSWSTTGELNTLAAGTYDGDLVATRTSDNKQRVLKLRLIVGKAVL